jgi:hypothetical protein
MEIVSGTLRLSRYSPFFQPKSSVIKVALKTAVGPVGSEVKEHPKAHHPEEVPFHLFGIIKQETPVLPFGSLPRNSFKNINEFFKTNPDTKVADIRDLSQHPVRSFVVEYENIPRL